MIATLHDDLISALRRGERTVIASTLAANIELTKAVDANGMTLLHHAVASEQLDIVIDLLALPHISLDVPESVYGRTPLHIAAIKGRILLIRQLLDAGANVFAVDVKGLRPLDIAGSPEAITELRPSTLQPARALREGIRSHALLRVARQLQASPELCRFTDADGCSPLHWAVMTGNEPVVTAILQAGVAITAADKRGQTPLHLAVIRGDIPIITRLLAAEADPNIATHQGISPLHLAAGHGDASRPLLIPAPDDPIMTPVLASVEQAREQGAFDFSFAPQPLNKPRQPHSATQDYVLVTTLLLQAGADVNARARGGVTPLHLAADIGDASIVALLLQHGALRAPELAHQRTTPIQLAQAHEFTQIVKYLLK